MNRPLKVAAASGIVALCIYLIIAPIVVLGIENSPIRWIISFLGIILGGTFSILFLNGFLVLGNKFKSTLLSVMSWIGIGLLILYLAFGTVMTFSLFIKNASAIEAANIPFVDIDNLDYLFGEAVRAFVIFTIIVYVVSMAVIGTYSILFGVGLLILKRKVKYAPAAGILNIVAGATYIIMIGFVVAIAARIVELVMLFKASEKFE